MEIFRPKSTPSFVDTPDSSVFDRVKRNIKNKAMVVLMAANVMAQSGCGSEVTVYNQENTEDCICSDRFRHETECCIDENGNEVVCDESDPCLGIVCFDEPIEECTCTDSNGVETACCVNEDGQQVVCNDANPCLGIVCFE